jgi:hypothetical protein
LPGIVALAVPAAYVWSTIEVVGGHAEAAAPVAQLVGVVERISTVVGENEQEDSFGRPEQDSVTNIGAVSEALFCGVTVTLTVPALPAVRVIGSDAGETAVKVNAKFGVELVCACTSAFCEIDV